jgi:hypothetical protein
MLFTIIGIIFMLIIIYYRSKTAELLKYFQKCSVLVFGKKGKGKDLVFQHVIKNRKKPYYSNIPYGYKYNHLEIKDISLAPNTYEDFIQGSIKKVDNKLKDKYDFYISDAGVYLPSQYHSLLDKQFKSFPIYFALSRHLNLMNIHANTQSLNRIWDKLREQFDYYIRVKRTIKIFNLFFTTMYVYDRYQSAKMELEPMKKKFSNQYNNALQRQYESMNGEIKKITIVTRKKIIKYDTRVFKSKVYNQ